MMYDDIKNRLSVEMGYNLLRVWEDEIKNVPEYIHQQERWHHPRMG
jgi:very-short-patch-repair endonuclease